MTSVTQGTAADVARSDRGFLGHPIGLAYLAFAEAWERFSYYGMLGMLTLYLTTHLVVYLAGSRHLPADPLLERSRGRGDAAPGLLHARDQVPS